MFQERLDPEVEAKILDCLRCYYIGGANRCRARASTYEGMPCLQSPIYKTAESFAAAADPICTCGLNLTFDGRL